MRFADHRGLSLGDCSLTEDAFRGNLARTKTTGKDKKIQSRVLHVSRNCWLLDPEWLPVGWELWKTAAPWDRDYFLPVPTRSLEHWERYECKYAEAAVLSRVLEAYLQSNNTDLLCPKVPGLLWKEHSPRAFLPSCTGCLKYPKNWQDALGGWSPGQSQGYVRTARQRIAIMQSHVAQLLRQGKGEILGETDLENDIAARLLQLGFTEEVVQDQTNRLLQACEFRTKANKNRNSDPVDSRHEDSGEGVGLWDSGEEEELLEQSEDEIRTWRIGIREGEPASESVLNVQDTEHAVSFVEGRTITREAEEAVEMVPSSSSQCTEGSERREEKLAEVKKVLKKQSRRCHLEKFKFARSAQPEKCGLARAVEPIRAELSSNLSECESARALEPIHSESSVQADTGDTSVPTQSKHKGRPKGICETKTRPSLKRHERASYTSETHLEPGFLVAYSHKLRCLHYIGRCWRRPGRDIKRWTYFGDKLPMEKDYDHYCLHCWKRGEQPESVSDRAAPEEDSGSSSTDA